MSGIPGKAFSQTLFHFGTLFMVIIILCSAWSIKLLANFVHVATHISWMFSRETANISHYVADSLAPATTNETAKSATSEFRMQAKSFMTARIFRGVGNAKINLKRRTESIQEFCDNFGPELGSRKREKHPARGSSPYAAFAITYSHVYMCLFMVATV